MNKTQEALKMAIEFMDLIEQYASNDNMPIDNNKLNEVMAKAQNACKEALKPHPDCDEACMFQCQMERKHSQEQEPVAWGMKFNGVIMDCICPEEHDREEGQYTIPLYTHPAQPLSDDEIEIAFNNLPEKANGTNFIIRFARAIEKAHGIE